jgi:hypothetical protein
LINWKADRSHPSAPLSILGGMGRDYGIPWKEIDPLLGTMPDVKLATRFKTSKTAIGLRREFCKIAVYTPKDFWTPKRIKLLGTNEDAIIAKKLGVSQQRVSQKRRDLEIPSWHDATSSTAALTLDGDDLDKLDALRLKRETRTACVRRLIREASANGSARKKPAITDGP